MRVIFILILSFFALNTNASSDSKTTDPYKYVWTENEGKVAGLVRFYTDIDGDKKPELFVGAKALLGNGGGIFHVFKVLDKRQYRYLGEVFVAPDAIEVLSSTRNGFHQIKSYHHLSAYEGNMHTFTFNGTKFILTAEKKIKSEDFSKGFKPLKIDTEESGPMLNWEP